MRSSAAEKLKTSLAGVSPFAQSLTDQFKREADMLEKIRGPMRDYQQGHQSLQMLYQKNQISAEEYREEVEKLNASISKTPKGGPGGGEHHGGGLEVEGSLGKSIAGRFGEVWRT